MKCFSSICLISFALSSATTSPVASCGANPSPECIEDVASCGNSCCSAKYSVDKSPQEVYDNIKSYFESGGVDGLFTWVSGYARVGYQGWESLIQGTHTTFIAKYNDTLNFAIRSAPQGGSDLRIFSISNIAGAVGDQGQNHRTVRLLGSELNLGPMTILFGCGASPSLPALLNVGVEMPALQPLQYSVFAWIERGLCALLGGSVAVFFTYLRRSRDEQSNQYYLVA
mmetsp:Transcript_107971/g.170380  ORF Transcript_107971/g.170380 Transcript_107971/m.170380 type:complete len:227 (-) Transcript_107971:164-844(-)|eukprot:CAMPEP_0169119594 /NCGR_PEP_ID=MMETSP1015-20121227/31644_1 /TAXON_ID=342587 /ORGANISM="Karlodinium micrum, Strain CCMP2283" /LENGTH=226 /DNA_ID=CAMNT_0009182493 /DNA_START=48 /DNA_END=728 /DNA_ORIENTATION=+